MDRQGKLMRSKTILVATAIGHFCFDDQMACHVPSHPNRYCPTQIQFFCLPLEVAQLDRRNACQFLPGLYTY